MSNSHEPLGDPPPFFYSNQELEETAWSITDEGRACIAKTARGSRKGIIIAIIIGFLAVVFCFLDEVLGCFG